MYSPPPARRPYRYSVEHHVCIVHQVAPGSWISELRADQGAHDVSMKAEPRGEKGRWMFGGVGGWPGKDG